ncbi:ly6/PLAUR domain-containing protein 6B isoform X2 [Grus americana]|uniref:ly6/PLAUR domain-containing protein 6B isoform X2 n=1 Tax=Grus americana TaxID=9117 RepID=UPI0024087842|nr:ly6/PLAUR domain-containing protein 6B isoform X2 [Grus americana]
MAEPPPSPQVLRAALPAQRPPQPPHPRGKPHRPAGAPRHRPGGGRGGVRAARSPPRPHLRRAASTARLPRSQGRCYRCPGPAAASRRARAVPGDPPAQREFNDRGKRSLLFCIIVLQTREALELCLDNCMRLQAGNVTNCMLVLLCHLENSWAIKPSEL